LPGASPFSHWQPGCPYAARLFLCRFSEEKNKKKLKKVKKYAFFLQYALDKPLSRAILLVLTGQTGNNASPESKMKGERKC
jgi:hypothetical protein